MASAQDNFDLVEMTSGNTQSGGLKLEDCEVDFGACRTRTSFYATAPVTYDLILSIDWLEAHAAIVDCRSKELTFYYDDGHKKTLKGKNNKYPCD